MVPHKVWNSNTHRLLAIIVTFLNGLDLYFEGGGGNVFDKNLDASLYFISATLLWFN